MKNTKKCCGCSPLNNFTTCDEQTQTSSNNTEIIMDSNTILLTDKILIIRGNCKENRVYTASLNDLSPDVALLILSKAVQVMPKTDPRDGSSFWNNNGCICIASDPISASFL